MTFRIGIQLASLRMPLKQALLTAGQLGAQSVEIDARTELKPGEVSETALRQLRKTLADANLRVGAVRFATRRGYHDPAELDRRVEATKSAMRLAYALRAPVVVNAVGQVPPAPTDDAEPADPRWSLMVEVLRDLGEYGAKAGARLAARTGSEEGRDLARLLAALPDAAIAVDFDAAALVEGGFHVLDAAAALGRYVAHVRARDAVRDRSRGRGTEVQLGRGSVDFPALFGALEEFAYRGDVTIERNQAADPVGDVRQAVAYLKSMNS